MTLASDIPSTSFLDHSNILGFNIQNYFGNFNVIYFLTIDRPVTLDNGSRKVFGSRPTQMIWPIPISASSSETPVEDNVYILCFPACM